MPGKRFVGSTSKYSLGQLRLLEGSMKIATITALLMLLCFGSVRVGNAQDSPQNDNAKNNRSAKVRKLTGCIEQSPTGKDYVISSPDGSSWHISSDAVDLAPHVGHKVMVTGTVDHQKMHAAKEKVKGEDNGPEHGHLTVTNIKMISKTCSH
jgi:hypothetical protein